MLGEDVGLKSISDPMVENSNNEQKPSRNTEENGNQERDSSTLMDSNSRNRSGGLLERMAARAGFNAPRLNTENLSQKEEIRSPYLTIPPGLSPTTLLDSPVFLSNSLVQPSPTTGKYQFVPTVNCRSSMFMTGNLEKNKDTSFFDNMNSSSFAFKPVPESNPSLFLGSTSKQFFPSSETVENLVTQSTEKETTEDSGQSPPPADQQMEDATQRISGDNMSISSAYSSEDGYNWRKYGQKQVKGSEYPRSYYKCTHPNCPVKKKVERSHEGNITEIVYKAQHNHLMPPPNRRSQAIGPSGDNVLFDVPEEGGDDVAGWPSMQKYNKNNNVEVTSSGALEYNPIESGDAVDRSSTFSNDEDEDECATHGSASAGCDGEEDESESKRRKIEAYANEVSGASRTIREPRVVVQTTSEVDILDDGYRWRKYGQKVVKGNPNPRSYYKCTNAGCTVRKHVERASHDLKSVITTYEGKHNHDVPAARNSGGNHPNTGGPVGSTQAQRPEPPSSHVQNGMGRFERPPHHSFGAYGLAGRQQMGGGGGPNHPFHFGMSQQAGFASLAMAGLGPMHPYFGQARPVMNDMGFMMPKGEPKVEPVNENGGINSINNNNNNGSSSSVYHQIMSRLPLGPQM
jgi:WRKY transcription factor 2